MLSLYSSAAKRGERRDKKNVEISSKSDHLEAFSELHTCRICMPLLHKTRSTSYTARCNGEACQRFRCARRAYDDRAAERARFTCLTMHLVVVEGCGGIVPQDEPSHGTSEKLHMKLISY